MFDRCSLAELSELLGYFHVPMFAAQRSGAAQDFCYICSNEALSDASGFAPKELQGTSAGQLFPHDEARGINSRFEICASTQKDLRFFETQTTPKGKINWETLLQYVPLQEGGDRIIGTSIEIDQIPDAAMLDDLRYLACLADVQLSNIVSLLETSDHEALFRHNSTQRTAQLAALCRSVQRAIGDLRERVPQTHLSAQHNRSDRQSIEEGGQMMRALYEAADYRR